MKAATSPPIQTSPISPTRSAAPTAVLETSSQSPTRTNGVPSRAGLTTAEDLLKNVIGGNRPPPQQPPHLFSANLLAQSIWSTSQDEQRMLAGASRHASGSPLFHSPTHPYSSLDATHVLDIPNMSPQPIRGPPLPYSQGGFDGSQHGIHANTVSTGLGMDNAESFAQQYSQPGFAAANGVNGGRINLSPHRHGLSLSQQLQLQQQQQYQVQPPLSLPFPSPDMMADSSFGLSMDGIGSSSFAGAMDPRGGFYNSSYRNGASPFHTRHLSYTDPRLGGILPPSVWGNT